MISEKVQDMCKLQTNGPPKHPKHDFPERSDSWILNNTVLRILVLAKRPIWTNVWVFTVLLTASQQEMQEGQSLVIRLCFLVLLSCLILLLHTGRKRERRKGRRGAGGRPADLWTEERNRERRPKIEAAWGDRNQEKHIISYFLASLSYFLALFLAVIFLGLLLLMLQFVVVVDVEVIVVIMMSLFICYRLLLFMLLQLLYYLFILLLWRRRMMTTTTMVFCVVVVVGWWWFWCAVVVLLFLLLLANTHFAMVSGICVCCCCCWFLGLFASLLEIFDKQLNIKSHSGGQCWVALVSYCLGQFWGQKLDMRATFTWQGK